MGGTNSRTRCFIWSLTFNLSELQTDYDFTKPSRPTTNEYLPLWTPHTGTEIHERTHTSCDVAACQKSIATNSTYWTFAGVMTTSNAGNSREATCKFSLAAAGASALTTDDARQATTSNCDVRRRHKTRSSIDSITTDSLLVHRNLAIIDVQRLETSALVSSA